MSYAITTSLIDAEVLIATIDEHQGYPRDGTTTHAVPVAHPEVLEWAVALDGLDVSEPWLSAAVEGLWVFERLDADWFPGGYQ